MSLQPLVPVILSNISNIFTLTGTCTTYGIPSPVVSWKLFDEGIDKQLLNAINTVNGNMIVSVITVTNLNITHKGSSIMCLASNVVGNTSAIQALYLAGKN